EHGPARAGVARDHELPARARRTEDGVRRDRPPVRERDRLAALEQPALRTGRDAERVRGRDVEAARAVVLDERVADGRDAVRDLERLDPVVAALEDLAGPQLDELVLVGELPEDPAERAEQVTEARRPVDRDRELAAAEREGLEEPREAE